MKATRGIYLGISVVGFFPAAKSLIFEAKAALKFLMLGTFFSSLREVRQQSPKAKRFYLIGAASPLVLGSTSMTCMRLLT
jgi:hypothetical protein